MARKKEAFQFKQFLVNHDRCAHKVGTDGVLLGAWVDVLDANRILEVGTGSGVIALMMAQRSAQGTHIDAIDISSADCEQAKENIASSPWPDKVNISHTPFQKFESASYDLIVSNPPFFINSAKPPKKDRTRARHTESLPPFELLTHARDLLTNNGKLCLILPVAESQRFISQAEESGWFCTRVCEFRARLNKPVERILFQLHLKKRKIQKESLVLYQHEAGEEWTTAYKNLTHDFYLKL